MRSAAGRQRRGTASETSPSPFPMRRTPTGRPSNRGARGVVEPHWVGGRLGPRRARRDRDLRRQHPHVRQPLRVRGYVPPRLPVGVAERPAVGRCRPDSIDHVVGNVELGRMDEWVGFYERVLGFSQLTHFSDEDISTEYSALMSKVMTDGEEDQVPDQRACGGQAQEPDRGVPRVPRPPECSTWRCSRPTS